MIPPIPLEEAQQRLLARAALLPSEEIEVLAANGRYLTGPLAALRTQPAADLSSMDGYAVSGNGPWTLAGESRAGQPFQGRLDRGQTVRISTGAIVPLGTERILIQEDAAVDDWAVTTSQAPGAHTYIRPKGFDFCSGDMVLAAGSYIGPAQIALILSAGLSRIQVGRLPTIALIEAGDELVADPSTASIATIPASNNAMLAAMTSGMTSRTRMVGPVPDKLDPLMAAIESCSEADVIITSGGASVGDHDLVQPALKALGAEIDFWRVAIKPGKPLLVGRLGQQIVLGLPGNPVSSFATAFLFLLPLLRRMAGAPDPLPTRVTAKLAKRLPANGPRRQFLRAIWDGSNVTAISEQDSSALRALASANALIEREEHCGETEAGTYVPLYPLPSASLA